MYQIYHFLFWGVVWFFCPRQIWSPSSVSSVENDKRLVILEMDGPQFENSIEVWTFFFLHTNFSMKETLYVYWYCGQSWKQTCPYLEYPFSCLCWGPNTFDPMWSTQAGEARAPSCKRVASGRTLGVFMPKVLLPRKPQESWQQVTLDQTYILKRSWYGPSVPRLPSTHLFLLAYVSVSSSLLLVLVKSSNLAKVKRIKLV